MPTTLLLGQPGSGKSVMTCTTLPSDKYPVHVFDLDRKIKSMALLKPFLDDGRVTYVELNETFQEESLTEMVLNLASRAENKQKPTKKPLGWIMFDEMLTNASKGKDQGFSAAKTVLVDSFTVAVMHLMRLISFNAGTFAYEFKEWGALLQMCHISIMSIIDLCAITGKDLVMTVHERDWDVPDEHSKVTYSVGQQGASIRTRVGQAYIKTAASIPGQFGTQIGMLFTDVYGLSVETPKEKGEPKWLCRVHPDWRRPFLRCSFPTLKHEHAPNFKQIWEAK
jgi:hypothetical protein